MKLLLYHLLSLAATTLAFQPPTRTTHKSLRFTLETNIQPDAGAIDMDRVQECTDSFGKCSVDELKQLKDDIIANRVQQFVITGEVDGKNLRHLEEEIDIQIGLLETENNIATEESNYDLSDKDHQSKKSQEHIKFDGHILDVPSAADMLMFEETLAEENLLEPLAMCLVVALLVFVPQLMS